MRVGKWGGSFGGEGIYLLSVAIMGSNNVNVVTTIPATVPAMGWKNLSPGALMIPGVMPNHSYCDPSLVLKTLSSGKGEKGSEKSCQTSKIFHISQI